jgi:glycosyltransferase involved in cell wall biosynthesis
MKPIRILHVLGAMNRGGVETWLMHLLRHIDRERFQMDFLVHTDQPAAYDAELLALGSKILRCPDWHRPIRYGKHFLRIIREFGPFDVLHSHVHNFSGYVVWLGHAAGIPVRISHSHSDTSFVGATATHTRRAYLSLSRWLLTKYSTSALAASAPAASALFGPSWQQGDRVKILYCGIDLAPYSMTVDRAAVRSEFGFRASNIVFGHVGSFRPPKNHAFLADIAAEIAKREPEARFLLVGNGPLRAPTESQFRRAGLGHRAVFAGSRPDVPRLMLGAMDGFLFPSLYEGLGLVLIEAQAANLPAIISDTVPSEAIVIPSLIRSLSLKQSAATWAETALHHRTSSEPNALAAIERSPFVIDRSIERLTDLYSMCRTET